MKRNKSVTIGSLVASSIILVIAGYYVYQIIDIAKSTNSDKIGQIE